MTKLSLVVDADGRVVAAGHVSKVDPKSMNTEIVPLPGQKMHLVEVPAELARLTSGLHFQLALSRAVFDAATATLRFKPIKSQKPRP